ELPITLATGASQQTTLGPRTGPGFQRKHGGRSTPRPERAGLSPALRTFRANRSIQQATLGISSSGGAPAPSNPMPRKSRAGQWCTEPPAPIFLRDAMVRARNVYQLRRRGTLQLS